MRPPGKLCYTLLQAARPHTQRGGPILERDTHGPNETLVIPEAATPGTAAPPGRERGLRLVPLAILLGLFCIYYAHFRDCFSDAMPNLALGVSLVTDGDFYLENNMPPAYFAEWTYALGEHRVSRFPPGMGFVAAVPLAILHHAGRLVTLLDANLAALLFAALLSAAVPALLYVLATREMGLRPGTGLFAALALGLSTNHWTYAATLYPQNTLSLLVLVAFYALLHVRRGGGAGWALAAGAALGIAQITRYETALIAVCLFGYLLWPGARRPRPVVWAALLAPMGAASLFLLWYHAAMYGSPWVTSYHAHGAPFHTPFLVALSGVLLSPSRGLFVYCPVTLAAVAGLARMWRAHRPEAALIAGLSLLLVALYSWYPWWWAGMAWGPRFLVPLLPFLVLAAAHVWEESGPAWKLVLAGLFCAGLFGEYVGVFKDAQAWTNFVDQEAAFRHPLTFDYTSPPYDPIRWGLWFSKPPPPVLARAGAWGVALRPILMLLGALLVVGAAALAATCGPRRNSGER